MFSGLRDHSSGDRNPLIAITPEQVIGISPESAH
jgi:hypothetical protein